MGTFQMRHFTPKDEAAVVALWQRCGLVVWYNDPHEDIRRKMAYQPELFFVGTLNEKGDETIIASIMIGYEGHRGWINYLAVAPAYQGRGYGRRLMADAETVLRELDCPKIDLLVRSSNREVIAFYEQLGFEVSDAVLLGKLLVEPDIEA
ncbi:MAG: GNAT family acetyltransferase [Anaerolineales bacterium]